MSNGLVSIENSSHFKRSTDFRISCNFLGTNNDVTRTRMRTYIIKYGNMVYIDLHIISIERKSVLYPPIRICLYVHFNIKNVCENIFSQCSVCDHLNFQCFFYLVILCFSTALKRLHLTPCFRLFFLFCSIFSYITA